MYIDGITGVVTVSQAAIPLIAIAAAAAIKKIMDKKAANNAANAASAADYQTSETKYGRDFQAERDVGRRGYLSTEYGVPKQDYRLKDALRLGRLYGATGSREHAPRALVDLLQTGRRLAPWEEPTKIAGVAPKKAKLGGLDYAGAAVSGAQAYMSAYDKKKADERGET